MEDIAQIARKLGKSSRSGDGWKCLCPAHDDHNPSLSITKSESGHILVYCHAGCTQDAVIAEVQRRRLWRDDGDERSLTRDKGRLVRNMDLIMPVPANAPAPMFNDTKLGTPSHVWEYKDADGHTLGFIRRFESNNGKTFRPLTCWQTKDGTLTWRPAGFIIPRPLYGLNLLADRIDEPVIITEGEKTADAAAKLLPNYVAISWPNGAKSVTGADWSPMSGRDVFIWPDADTEGEKSALEVARQCLKHGAASVKILQIESASQ